MGTTSIEWTNETWNPVRGCSRVSPGCGGAKGQGGCYAERLAIRMSAEGQPYHGLVRSGPQGPRWTGEVAFDAKALSAPLSWRKPRRVFVNSMSDLFHEALTNEQIAAVFGVMSACPQHTFQVLTKRAERMAQWFEWMHPDPIAKMAIAGGRFGLPATVAHRAAYNRGDNDVPAWPPPNVWIGVSVEDQKRADERIPHLLRVPAAVRFLSCEPLLEAVDVSRYMWPTHWHWDSQYRTPEAALAAGAFAKKKRQALVSAHASFVDWVIVGGESGPGSRPFDVAWARSIVRQCREAGSACFVKQIGPTPHSGEEGAGWAYSLTGGPRRWRMDDRQADGSLSICDIFDRKGGDWAEWPEDLRVREWPEARS